MKAKLKVYNGKIKGRINRNIYGHFIEHLGRCVYGGIYDENSPLSDENGFRKDVMEAIKKIKIPVLRWPGGNFASNYHWLDGIGPKEKRPKKLDTAWVHIWGKLAEDTNHFGTDEFLKYCEMINTQPYICLNFGTGTLDEALAWVEYCNYEGDTYYANLRRKNGREKAYKVKYWGLGNEIYGKWQHGYCSPTEYGEKAREYAHFIKKIDPDIKVIAVGANNPDWDLEVIKRAGEEIDYISIHMYFSPERHQHYKIVALPYYVEKRLSLLESVIEVGESYIKREKPIEIAFDEWNIWRAHLTEEENYTLSDALFACGFFHILHRHCERVTMANLAQLVNILGLIQTTPESMVLTTLYYAFYLYSNNTGKYLIESQTEIDTFDEEYNGEKIKNVPYLDVSVTSDEEFLYIAGINRHLSEAIETEIIFYDITCKEDGEVFFISGETPEVMNTKGKENVNVKSKKLKIQGNKFFYEFPPLSATVIKLKK